MPSPSIPLSSRKTYLIIAAGAVVMSMALGSRQTFGLFISPLSYDYGLPVTLIAFAIALHNLVWGFAQPLAGAATDRWGPAPVVAFGALAYGVGLAMTALASSGWMLALGMGVFIGVGISCTSFGVVLTAVGRNVAPQRRSMALGLASAGGSLGQVLMVPLVQGMRSSAGITVALLALAALVAATAPLGLALGRRAPSGVAGAADDAGLGFSLRAVVAQACRHRGYRLLTAGFFACGFQLAFIATHLPGYLELCHMPMGLAATALALIGLFNMAGSWTCGWLGGRFRQQHVLGWLYLVRSAAIGLFFVLPKSELSVTLFAAVMGLTWLGTVPLTSGLVARIFGTRHMGTLFGVCFLSHQLGSFLGAWLGGLALDLTGSYTLLWGATFVAGVMAALLHFPIDERDAAAAMAKA
ncbi:MFS transporter [Herbaspirillum sp. WKF16]|uniref:MFS transporter n=1 Tax=Herbaspirillum sp. WKF16 TaxID=3028312 RepID=UPI0023A91982|nr:MFS transporter [Herbaspirillum sp. WKF16]WDZ97280.1 MFS transporter [Herbaspirillum sp. WKF16]